MQHSVGFKKKLNFNVDPALCGTARDQNGIALDPVHIKNVETQNVKYENVDNYKTSNQKTSTLKNKNN
jgi:hypothetical protein